MLKLIVATSMLLIFGRIRVVARINRVLATNQPVAPFDRQLSAALFFQHFARGIRGFLLRAMNARSAAAVISFVYPIIAAAINGTVSVFAHSYRSSCCYNNLGLPRSTMEQWTPACILAPQNSPISDPKMGV